MRKKTTPCLGGQRFDETFSEKHTLQTLGNAMGDPIFRFSAIID